MSKLDYLPTSAALNDAARQIRTDGFCIVRGLFSTDEIAAFDIEAKKLLTRTDLIDDKNMRCRWQSDVGTGACVFDAFDPVTDLCPLFHSVAHDARLQSILQAVYGEPAHLFRDKLIFKPPGATGYGLHQDYVALKTFPRSFLSVLVAIDLADAANGCTEVFPGVHQRGCLMPEDGMYHEIPPGMIDESCGVKLEMAPGDVALFGAFTPHRSGINRSRTWRRQLYMSYNAASEGGDCRAEHYREFREWLRDRYAEFGRTEVHFA